MKIGAVIIGDELLIGKRQDKHFTYLQNLLAKRRLELSWTIIVGDDAQQLERFLGFSLASDDLVFCFGGIGATPDDRTRQTVAKVTDVDLVTHPEAIIEIEKQFGQKAHPKRLLLAELPKGSEIIPNPINRVPGFSFRHHHFMPGFPEMSWPMIDWLFEHKYNWLTDLAPAYEQSIYITKARESDLLEIMNHVIDKYPSIRLSSLPKLGEYPHIEFSLRGDKSKVEQAMAEVKSTVEEMKFEWHNQLTKN